MGSINVAEQVSEQIHLVQYSPNYSVCVFFACYKQSIALSSIKLQSIRKQIYTSSESSVLEFNISTSSSLEKWFWIRGSYKQRQLKKFTRIYKSKNKSKSKTWVKLVMARLVPIKSFLNFEILLRIFAIWWRLLVGILAVWRHMSGNHILD